MILHIRFFFLSEHAYHPFEALHQGIHLFTGIVQGKRGPHCTLNAQTVNQRLCTMMTRTYGYAQTVEQGPHIHGMDITHQETYHSIFLCSLSINAQSLYLLQLLGGIACERHLMMAYGFHT